MQIIAIINGETLEAVEAYGAAKFYSEVLGLLQDTAYWTFFASFVEMTPTK